MNTIENTNIINSNTENINYNYINVPETMENTHNNLTQNIINSPNYPCAPHPTPNLTYNDINSSFSALRI
jgi:hypothetical protein